MQFFKISFANGFNAHCSRYRHLHFYLVNVQLTFEFISISVH